LGFSGLPLQAEILQKRLQIDIKQEMVTFVDRLKAPERYNVGLKTTIIQEP
jgi:hypothetical protein